MIRLWVWVVKSILGAAQFALLSRLADRTGLRYTWIHPVARSLSQMTGLGEGFLEILIVAATACWLVWLLSALCRCLTAVLGQTTLAGQAGPHRSQGSVGARQ